MSANLIEAIQEKLNKLAEAAPKTKVVIISDEKQKEKIDEIIAYAKELGLEVSVKTKDVISDALQKTAEVFSVSFDIREAEKIFEREINSKRFEMKPIPMMEAPKRILDRKKSMHREHMKQMRRYQNKHWKK
jgi:hypothetical protein